MTRLEQVRTHLYKHGYITNGIFLLVYGATNGLAQRINDLRRKYGLVIDTVKEKDERGNRVCRYKLRSHLGGS